MFDQAILENGITLKSVPNCYKNYEMCNKAVNNYPQLLEFLPECYKTQKMVNLLILILLQLNIFLNTIRLNKCVLK